MIKIRILLISFMLMLFANGCVSQDKILQIPEKYKYPTESINYNKSNITVPGTIWTVYSDRNNNKTYESAYSVKEKTSLQFLEKVYVIDEVDNYLHLIKGTNIDESGKLYEDCGWIEKQYLLLWEHCLYSILKNVEKKAIIINTIDYVKEGTIGDGKTVLAYSDPDMGLNTGKNLEMFDFYFVYKISKNSVLIGNKTRISVKDTINTNIIGWVPISRVVFWDTKVGIEPNWDNDAVKERKKNKADCRIFADELSAELYRTKKNVNDDYAIWKEDIGQRRNSGNWLRFQLLDNYNNILKIGFQGQIVSAIDSLGNNVTIKNYLSNRTLPFPLSTYKYLKIIINNMNLQQLCNNNYQLYLMGYAPSQILDCGYPQFKSSILLSRLELGNLILKLKQFYEAFVPSENEYKYQSKVKELYKLENPGKSDGEIMDMRIGDIIANIFYVSSKTKVNNCKLSGIILPTIISKDDFKNYCDKLTLSIKELEMIYNGSEFEFIYYYKNKDYYYWISEEYLP